MRNDCVRCMCACILIADFLFQDHLTLLCVPARNIRAGIVREWVRRVVQQCHTRRHGCVSGRDAEDVNVSNVAIRVIDDCEKT